MTEEINTAPLIELTELFNTELMNARVDMEEAEAQVQEAKKLFADASEKYNQAKTQFDIVIAKMNEANIDLRGLESADEHTGQN